MIVWKPKVGDRVKLRTWNDYASRNLGMWGWFEVLELGETTCKVKTILDAIGVESTEHTFNYNLLQKPLGWSEVYSLTAPDKESAELAKKWFDDGRGVCIWTSQDLGTAGRTMFTPGDRLDKPHWSMELVEVVMDIARVTIQYAETRITKPDKSEKSLWTKSGGEYFRYVQLEAP